MTVRRVVTADAKGEAAIASDAAVEPLPIGEARLYELWRAGPGGAEAALDAPWSLEIRPPAAMSSASASSRPPRRAKSRGCTAPTRSTMRSSSRAS